MAECLTTTQSASHQSICPHCGHPLPVGVKIDLGRNLVYASGGWVKLTGVQTEILETIREDGPIPAHEIVLRVKGPYGNDIGEGCIRTQICYMRPKLTKIGIWIGNVHGRGYVIV